MRNEREMLEKIIAMGNMMTQMKDTDILLESILTEARRLSNCDAGSIYKCEEDMLIFSYTQNDTQSAALPKGKKLAYSTFKIPVDEKSIAGYVAKTSSILNIPDVYQLDSSVPYSFNPSFDQRTNYHTGSVLTIPMLTASGMCIGVLQLINALDNQGKVIPFANEDVPYIRHFANTAAVALEKADMTRSIILRMIKMAELRDPKETGAHVNRVGAYSAELYEAWAGKHGISESTIQHNKDLLRIAAMLHDVGKVGIPDAVLKKPGKLNDEEYEIMKTHPIIGATLFGDPNSELDLMSREIALSHHERWDGRGYPGNVLISRDNSSSYLPPMDAKPIAMIGDAVPLWARIVAITDVYDALSCRRCYKEPWTQENVYEELKRCAGSQFDPELIEIFFSIREIIQSIREKYPDAEE